MITRGVWPRGLPDGREEEVILYSNEDDELLRVCHLLGGQEVVLGGDPHSDVEAAYRAASALYGDRPQSLFRERQTVYHVDIAVKGSADSYKKVIAAATVEVYACHDDSARKRGYTFFINHSPLTDHDVLVRVIGCAEADALLPHGQRIRYD